MREWLEPDGLGGFAMGTVSGVRTRRYHGLLLTATTLPNQRETPDRRITGSRAVRAAGRGCVLAMEPIVVDPASQDVSILGVLVGVIRKY